MEDRGHDRRASAARGYLLNGFGVALNRADRAGRRRGRGECLASDEGRVLAASTEC
jgi:hypothetical protein